MYLNFKLINFILYYTPQYIYIDTINTYMYIPYMSNSYIILSCNDNMTNNVRQAVKTVAE